MRITPFHQYSFLKKLLPFVKLKRKLAHNGINTVKSHAKPLSWLNGYLSRTQFLIFSGILVGCSSGLAGVLLKTLVHHIHSLITKKLFFEQQVLFYLIFPLLGISLTALVVIIFFKGQDRKGIPAILYEIAQNSSIISPVKMYSQIVQSAITVGFGGSAGLESPIAVTGAAIGSNFAKTYGLDYRDRTLLLAAGATAGIAAAFNAPIAGMMFAFEILLTGVVFTDFIPLIVAAVCGSLISRIILNEETLFLFNSRHAFNYRNIPYYIVLALASGFYARYFLIVSQWVEHKFHQFNQSRLQKALIGGMILSILCCLFPPLFGEGYQTVKDLVNGKAQSIVELSFFRYLPYHSWYVLIFAGLICLVKAFASSITIFSGGNGGNFAPSLFAGGALGYLIAVSATSLGLTDVPASNLIIVGMAGVMSGVLYAPLTAIFLIAESSSGYDLLIPLMIVSVTSYLIGKRFSAVAPDLAELAGQGKIFTREHDRNLLSLLHVQDMIDNDIQVIDVNAGFEELAEIIKSDHRNTIAAVNSENNLEGIITLDRVRPLMFSGRPNNQFKVRDLMIFPKAIIDQEDDMSDILKTFEETDCWNLPVIYRDKYVGFLSKSNILDHYRQLLKEYS